MACGRSCARVCPALGNSSRRAIQHLPGYGYKLGTWPFLQQSGLLLPCRRLQWKWNYPRYCHRFNKSSPRKLNASQPVTFLISTRCVGRKNVLSPPFQRVGPPVSTCWTFWVEWKFLQFCYFAVFATLRFFPYITYIIARHSLFI